LTQIYYFPDGAASQYKPGKISSTSAVVKNDFGMDTKWQLFAMSHGKVVCDGTGGTFKRLARKVSLQNPYQGQIMTPRELHKWAVA
jgi:hypothetical protein